MNPVVMGARSARDPRTSIFQSPERASGRITRSPESQSRDWADVVSRGTEPRRDATLTTPTRSHAPHQDGFPQQINAAQAHAGSVHGMAMDQQTFAVMMSQIMVMLTNLNARSDQTERMFARLEDLVAKYQTSVERLYDDMGSTWQRTRSPTPITRATSVRSMSTTADTEYDRSAIVIFSMDGRHIADDEFVSQLLGEMGMQHGVVMNYAPLAGGKGMKIQFNSIGAAVAVLRKRREFANVAKVRVDEDLPPNLRQLRQQNRPIFRYLLEVEAKDNTWYRMRGGKIQVNDTFIQEEDGQGGKTLAQRGTWRDFATETYAQVHGGAIDAWWKTRTDVRMTQEPPEERSAPEA